MFLKKVVLLCSLVLILMNLASAQYYFDQSFSGFGFFSGGGFDDILIIYENNSTWFDFFIFLLIFLGLTQAVFGEGHFKKQSKTISIGLSLALSFGLVFWERNTGVNLLTLGPFAFLILLLLIFYIIYSILKKMGTEWWVAGAWAYVGFFALLMILGPAVFNWSWLNENLIGTLNFFFYLCLILGLIGLWYTEPLHPRTPPTGGGHHD